ncbi:sigma-54 dependent transcriptional regulator [Caulobacter sp. 17J65-9]|uniref:sigma-54-dependent transcriptional regulator n=1 Tax=Caulobacter sp. 17J65-9 TaxID=2709382 RepID=UPI0013C95965|nr:sigma-54 dependent transcriptional regulator [Caulobacter sp. 17J65-9]NEX91532.1 sigma-54-dependent Fis family transcriptional regulator [Caulobacter sp. 17J65-9]
MFEDRNLIAFVDDDDVLREANVQTLQLAGFEVLSFGSAAEALEAVGPGFPGVVVSDIRMPQIDGRQLFRRLRDLDADLPVILITGHADVAEAVEALHEGAYDFVPKPYAAERLLSSVRRALEKRALVLDNRRLRREADRVEGDLPLVGSTPVMEHLRRTIRHVAEADVDVLVEGETGVGKELVARALHRLSRRRPRPFSVIDCGALPEAMIESELFGHEMGAFSGAIRKRVGRIEAADRGTLFLDEIENLPAAAQGKLLRVLEEREVTPLGANEARPVDLRVVAATKVDLGDPAVRGAFRADLYHRLNVVRIRIPPLRERRADVPLLFGRFLAQAAQKFGREAPALTDAVRRRLLDHDWPGNGRELSHFAERVVLGLEAPLAEAGAPQADSLPARVGRYEADLIREALDACAGDVRTALQRLSIPRKTFYDKLTRHGIDIEQYRPSSAR